MPQLELQQASFNSGELSSSLYSRTDLDKYRSGLRTARNFILHAQGGASNRQGSKLIASTKNSNKTSIVQEFIFNSTQAYILEFGDLYVRFYTDGDRIENNGTPYEVTTTYLEADLQDLKFESSADVIWITHPDYLTRTLTRYGNASWALSAYQPDDGPFMPENIDETVSLTVSAVTGSGVTLSVSATTDAYYVALIHGDGADGSTSIIDETGKTVTVTGNAQIDTDQSVFGGSSLLFDGASTINLADSDDWNFGTGPFTLQARIRATSLAAPGMIFAQYASGTDRMFVLLNTNGSLTFLDEIGGVTKANYSTSAGVVVANTWYDLEVGRNGGNFYIQLDGITQALSASTAVGANDLGNISAVMEIGGSVIGGNYFTGNIDEIAISKGIKRHTSNFTPATTAFSITSASTGFYFRSTHVGALFKLRHYIEGPVASTSFTSSTTSSSIKCFRTWRVISHGTWTGKFSIEKSVDGGTTWTKLRSFSSANDSNFDTSGTEDTATNPDPFLVRVNMYSYTSGTATIDLSSDPFYQDGIVRVTSYVSASSVLVTVLSTIGLTAATTSWFEGSWSDFRGYPTVSRFYQDRLCFAATPSEPQTIWTSQIGVYDSFLRNSPLLDTDAITVNVPSRQLNAINNLIAFKRLLAFTSSSIWSIGPISTTAFTPTSAQTDIEEYTGSSDIVPVVIGNESIYAQLDGNDNSSVIRTTAYALESDSFSGAEINILAKHLFENYSIVKVAYQRTPNSIVWALRDDGVLLGMTYLKEQQVIGWTRHDTTGTIKSICVVPGANGDELWMVVRRTNGYYVERMEGRRVYNVDDHVFLDSYKEYTSSTAVVSSLSHLMSMTVAAVGDDVDLGTFTVSASGTIGLSASYTDLKVGLRIAYPDLETLNIDIPLRSGTVQTSNVKVGSVVFNLINTRGGTIGPDENHLNKELDYTTLNLANIKENKTALGTTENFTGPVRVLTGAGYENGGRVFYRQTKAYPVTISAIVPEAAIGGPSG